MPDFYAVLIKSTFDRFSGYGACASFALLTLFLFVHLYVRFGEHFFQRFAVTGGCEANAAADAVLALARCNRRIK